MLILAGCGQETVSVAQAPAVPSTPESEISSQTTTPSTPTQTDTRKKTIPSEPEPVKSVPADPPKTGPSIKPANPEVTTPEPKKVAPPEEEELPPAELIARKLISNNPDDNLEVLNEALERWLTQRGDLPERMSDLVNEQFLPMLPMAPQGKSFSIDAANQRVVLITKK
jgi:hypothetical protein